MKVRELLELNAHITDVEITVRKNGNMLLDFLAIGPDAGLEPPYPMMIPNNEGAFNGPRHKAKYIRKSINAWDDGKDYYEIKVDGIPRKWLDLEVFSWRTMHVYSPHHWRDPHPGMFSFEGIQITALPSGESLEIKTKTEKKNEDLDENGQLIGQMSFEV